MAKPTNGFTQLNTKESSILVGAKGFCAYVKNGKSNKTESTEIKGFTGLWENASVCWIDYVIEDFEKDTITATKYFGFSEQLITNLLQNQRSGYEDFDNELGILLPAITAKGFDVTLSPLLILIKKNLILTLHRTEARRFFRLRRYAETFMRKLANDMLVNDKITSILTRILDENNNRNFEHLLEIEEQGDKLSDRLVSPESKRSQLGPLVHEMKHALVLYLGGLWATVDVISSVRYGDADLLTDDVHLLNRITALTTEVNSHIGLAEHLSEVLASGLEVIQSIYNNQLQVLNNRLALLMGYLTIIGTALLVPNTIATALASPVFPLTPNDLGWYTGLILISTIISTIIAWFIVKKMGLLPSQRLIKEY